MRAIITLFQTVIASCLLASRALSARSLSCCDHVLHQVNRLHKMDLIIFRTSLLACSSIRRISSQTTLKVLQATA